MIWEKFHSIAAAYADKCIFDEMKVDHFKKGTLVHKTWLDKYDEKIEELNRELFP